MSSVHKIVSGAIWSVAVNIVNAIYGFFAVPILINYFGKAEYGIIGLAMSINVYMQLMDMGFNNTNIRFFSAWMAKGDHRKIQKLFRTSLAFYGVIGLINAVVLLIIAFFAGHIFDLNDDQLIIMRNLLFILAVSAVISWYSSCFDQLIKATENVAWIQKRTLLPKLMLLIILGVTVWLKLSITLYFFLTTFSAFIIIPISIKKIKKEVNYVTFLPKIDWSILKEILPYSLNIFSFSIFQFSFHNLRPVFLGIQGTVESVADYRILNGITGIVAMVGSVFLSVLLPSSSRAVANNNKVAYYKVAYQGTRFITLVLSFCAFGVMSIGRELLGVYVGDDYLYLLPWLNLWLCFTLANHNQGISSLILSGTDIRTLSYMSAFSSIVGMFIAWILIPTYHVGGAVISLAVYCIFQAAFFYFYYWPRKMQINSLRVFTYSFMPFALLGMIVSLIIIPIDLSQNIWIALISKVGLFALTYSLIALFMLGKEDKQVILNIIKK